MSDAPLARLPPAAGVQYRLGDQHGALGRREPGDLGGRAVATLGRVRTGAHVPANQRHARHRRPHGDAGEYGALVTGDAVGDSSRTPPEAQSERQVYDGFGCFF